MGDEMRLKENTDLIRFIKTAAKCHGEVIFHSKDGDKLNLKSTLSQYLFAAAVGNEALLTAGTVYCELQEDADMLQEFMQ